MSKRRESHKAVEFTVDTMGKERSFKTFRDAATQAVVEAAATGRTVDINVLVFSEAGAHWFGGDEGRKSYREDPEASVFERISVRADAKGRIA